MSAVPDPILSSLLEPLIRRNTGVFYLWGGLGTASGAVLLGVVWGMPAQPDEVWIQLGITLSAVLAAVGSVGLGVWGYGQGAQVRSLALYHPQEIRQMAVVRVQKRAMVAWGLHLYDGTGRRVAITVPSEAAAQAVVSRLAERGARVG